MGNFIAKFFEKTNPIENNGNFESLTNDERQLLESHDEIFSNFHLHPWQKNLDEIKNAEETYIKSIGWKYYVFLIAACNKHQLTAKYSVEHKTAYNHFHDKIMDLSTILYPSDLDCLWILYYATGDTKYSDRVKHVVTDKTQLKFVQAAAIWSYNSHVEMKKIKGPKVLHAILLQE